MVPSERYILVQRCLYLHVPNSVRRAQWTATRIPSACSLMRRLSVPRMSQTCISRSITLHQAFTCRHPTERSTRTRRTKLSPIRRLLRR
ncbi:hypothetical protein DPMN_031974 [Dreissena polymorpha]|uniref:Uncharacterized protein n=1 Tax=Dreissena polymorpha TaxID=45954 RepID=A0A9D4M0Z3_DREPO|nr:hypothetical protein DPMN_031974 [Dreissena polymorpha]